MSVIKLYIEKPSFDPLEKKKSFASIHLGVELEYEAKNPANVETLAEKAGSILNVKEKDFVILKQDGTLQDGFEICSRPASLEFHRDIWPTFFKNIPAELRTFCFREKTNQLTNLKYKERDDNCGMHVHINRETLSDLQIGKIISFIHNRGNRSFIRKIAERDSNNFCNYEIERKIQDAKIEHYRELDRKIGVNLHNPNTLEIRIFKSPLLFSTFIKNLEFCEALVQFTLPSKRAIKDSANYQDFISFVNEYKKIWPNLHKFIQD